jgi:acyl-CoA reductase-like NAD-dependent aldehyde dehydrogenase
MTVQRTVSPIDQSVYVERELAEGPAIQRALEAARAAQAKWRQVPLEKRIAIVGRFVDAVAAHKDAIAEEITRQMGRPIGQAPGEVGGFAERARYMMQVAPEGLADVRFSDKPGFTRLIRKVPVGVVFVIAPWNYPYLTAVNAVVPSILAGNAVILKHSAQTPLTAERFAQAFAEAGLPAGVFQFLHTSHAAALDIIR